MKIWSRFPVFRFLIPFSAGIICCIYSLGNLATAIILTISGLILSWFFTRKNWATGKYAQRWLAGIPFYIGFWGLGFTLTWFHQSINFNNHFQNNFQQKATSLVVELYQPPVNTSKGYKILTNVKALKISDRWIAVRGNLLIYIRDTSHLFSCLLGDELIVNCKPQLIPAPSNPLGFDYAFYLHGKEIWHQAFINADNVKKIKSDNSYSINSIAIQLRNILLQKLEKFIKTREELGVAGALLLGYEDWLDPDLESSYSLAGVLHVLCVSGMHVGLIYAVFAWCLGFMEKKRFLRILRYLLLIFLTWFYALLTGFTPSVVRAAAMLTFVIAGKMMNKEANIYNLLCSSCFLLFTMDPFIIMSAGFQLSFLAVCGIVFLHRLILPLWVPGHKILFLIWELISISIAAQITTFPLSLYLFHQFPNYFLLGNLIIIPLSTLVMYSGLIFLLTDWIPYAGWLAGTLTTTGISWLNRMVVFLGKLPGAVTNNIYISFYELLGIYLFIFLIILWFILKWRSLLFSWMIVIIILQTIRIDHIYFSEKQNVLTVYDAGKQSLFSIINARQAYLAGGQNRDSINIKRVAGEYLISNLIQQTYYHQIPINSAGIFILPNGLKCTILNGWGKNFDINRPDFSIASELLILGGDIDVPAIKIRDNFSPRKVIFDSSLQRKQMIKLASNFNKLGIPTIDVKAKGAFQFEIK